MFGEVYRWHDDHEFLVMFVHKDKDSWSGPVLSVGTDTSYDVFEFDEWAEQGVTRPVDGDAYYWEKVE